MKSTFRNAQNTLTHAHSPLTIVLVVRYNVGILNNSNIIVSNLPETEKKWIKVINNKKRI